MSNDFEKVSIVIDKDPDAITPVYATSGSAGADLCACINDSIIIFPGESSLIPTGIRLEIADGFEVQIRPRSGLAFKKMVTVLNAPGTIDSDYRGEIKVLLINHGSQAFVVEHGMRIAQMVVSPVVRAEFYEGMELTTTTRGSGGFGHTGER